MAAHRYWRLYMFQSQAGSGSSQFAEVEFHATAGGADVTGSGTAACTASPQSGTAANAFDNNGTTFVQWLFSGPVWVSYDFGAGNSYDIVEVVVMGAVGSANRALGQGAVQWSDDNVNWTTAWTISYTTAYVTGTNVTFTKPTATSAYRYWRARFDNVRVGSSQCYVISAMSMATSAGGSNQCSGGTALCYSSGNGAASNAFDGNSSTFYGSTTGNSGYEFLGYDFGSGVTKAIVEIGLSSRQDNTAFFQQWPGTIYVEASTDGVNWLPKWTVSNSLQTYTAGPSYSIDPASISAGSSHRWWGIRPTTVQSGTSFGLQEIAFRATLGGSSMTTGGIAGDIFPFDNTVFAAKAFDGTSAEYGSSTISGEIVAYDFGASNAKPVPAQIMLQARATAQAQSPTAFDLVYSDDGANWTLQQSYTSPATWAGSETRLFPPASTRRRQIFMAS